MSVSASCEKLNKDWNCCWDSRSDGSSHSADLIDIISKDVSVQTDQYSQQMDYDFRSRKQKAQSCNISRRRNILAEQKHRFLSYRMLTRRQTGSDGGCGSNRTSEADQLWSGWWEVIRSESRNSNVKCESHRNTDTHTHTWVLTNNHQTADEHKDAAQETKRILKLCVSVWGNIYIPVLSEQLFNTRTSDWK